MPNLDLNMSDSPVIWIGILFLFIFTGWAWHMTIKGIFNYFVPPDDTSLRDNRPTASDTTGDSHGDTFGN